MRKLLLIAALFVPGVAWAADMPMKATPQPIGYPAKCGVYFGINGEGGAGAVNGAPPGTTMINGDVGALVGYACQVGGIPWFIEGLVDYQNLNASTPGFALSGPVHLEQRLAAQVPILNVLSLFNLNTGAIPNLPALPPGVSLTGSPANYIYFAANEDDISSQFGLATARAWLFSPEVGTGMLFPAKASGWNVVFDVWAGAELQSDSICVGVVACPKLATRFKTGFSAKF